MWHGIVPRNMQFALYMQTKTNLRITKPLMSSLRVLNVLQINIQKIIVFMHRVKTCRDVPSIFANNFTYHFHKYPTNFSKTNFALPKYLRKKSKYKLAIRGLSLWNKVLLSTEKELQETSLFKAKLKSTLLKMDDEVKYL